MLSDRDWDVEIGARTVWAEARDQGPGGMLAVAYAEVNRWRSGKWFSGRTLAGTCVKKYQFSSLNTDDPNRQLMFELPVANETLAICRAAVELAIVGGADPTLGATHYYNPKSVKEPDWVSGINSKTGQRAAPAATFTVQIGAHLYFKDVP